MLFLAAADLKLIYKNQVITNFEEVDLIIRNNGRLDLISDDVKIKIKLK